MGFEDHLEQEYLRDTDELKNRPLLKWMALVWAILVILDTVGSPPPSIEAILMATRATPLLITADVTRVVIMFACLWTWRYGITIMHYETYFMVIFPVEAFCSTALANFWRAAVLVGLPGTTLYAENTDGGKSEAMLLLCLVGAVVRDYPSLSLANPTSRAEGWTALYQCSHQKVLDGTGGHRDYLLGLQCPQWAVPGRLAHGNIVWDRHQHDLFLCTDWHTKMTCSCLLMFN